MRLILPSVHSMNSVSNHVPGAQSMKTHSPLSQTSKASMFCSTDRRVPLLHLLGGKYTMGCGLLFFMVFFMGFIGLGFTVVVVVVVVAGAVAGTVGAGVGSGVEGWVGIVGDGIDGCGIFTHGFCCHALAGCHIT